MGIRAVSSIVLLGLIMFCPPNSTAVGADEVGLHHIASDTGYHVSSRLTIGVIGDSMADGVWGGLYRTLRDDGRYKVIRGTKNASGFTRSKLLDLLQATFAEGPLDAVVVMVGANDQRSIFLEGGQALLAGTPAWDSAYRDRVTAFLEYLKAKRVPAVWVLLPVMSTLSASEAAQAINQIVTETSQSYPLVETLPTWELSADQFGNFTPTFKDSAGKIRIMRQSDGIHFTVPGSNLIAELVLRRFRTSLTPFRLLAAESANVPPRRRHFPHNLRSLKSWFGSAIVVLGLAVGLFMFVRWRRSEPRRLPLAARAPQLDSNTCD